MRDVQFVSRHRGIFDEWDAAAAGASATVSRQTPIRRVETLLAGDFFGLSGVLCVEPYTAALGERPAERSNGREAQCKKAHTPRSAAYVLQLELPGS